jgi:Transmembrane amino acid transporter protein
VRRAGLLSDDVSRLYSLRHTLLQSEYKNTFCLARRDELFRSIEQLVGVAVPLPPRPIQAQRSMSDDCEPQLRRKRRLNGDALSRLPFRAVSSSDDDELDSDSQLSPPLDSTPATTPWETWIHLVKGYIGPGCLSLPWAYSRFDNVGYGILATIFMALWTSDNCRQIVALKNQMQEQQQQQQQQWPCSERGNEDAAATDQPQHRRLRSSDPLTFAVPAIYDDILPGTYPNVAYYFSQSRLIYQITSMSVCIQQLAICTVFLSFTATNLQAVLFHHSPNATLPHVLLLTACLPLLLALVSLPNLSALAPVTAAGTLLLTLGLFIIFLVGILVATDYESTSLLLLHNTTNTTATNTAPSSSWLDVPLALCAILYSFEGINLILPICGAMATTTTTTTHRSRRSSDPPDGLVLEALTELSNDDRQLSDAAPSPSPPLFGTVFAGAMITVTAVFCGVATYCVAVFGTVSSGSITAFLLQQYQDEATLRHFLYLANTAVTLSVFVTYPLQLFPCLDALEPWLKDYSVENAVELPTEASSSTVTRTEAPPAAARRQECYGTRFAAAPDCWRPACDDDDDDDEKDTEMTRTTLALSLSPALSTTSSVSSRHSSSASLPQLATTLPPSRSNTPPPRHVLYRLVLLTYILAVAIPNVQSLISLAGALAGSSTALLIPPILELYALRKDASSSWARTGRQVRAYLYLVLGAIFLVIGTGASLVDIVKVYTK